MSIVRNIGFCQFCDAFRDADRNENFSYQGKKALFDYLEEYSDSTGEPVELDVIALCVDYTEDDTDSIIQQYSIDVSEALEDTGPDVRDIVRDYLNDNTLIIGETSSGFVFACF